MSKLTQAQAAALKELAQVLARDERSSRLKPKQKASPPPVDDSKPADKPTPEQEAELDALYAELAQKGGS